MQRWSEIGRNWSWFSAAVLNIATLIWPPIFLNLIFLGLLIVNKLVILNTVFILLNMANYRWHWVYWGQVVVGVSFLWMQYIHTKGIHAWDQVDWPPCSRVNRSRMCIWFPELTCVSVNEEEEWLSKYDSMCSKHCGKDLRVLRVTFSLSVQS